MIKKICGIYSITNTVNGRRYYGSSLNMQGRWRQHTHSLRSGNHRNKHLQAAWNLYGETNFVFAVAEEVVAADLQFAEQRYLDLNVGGYNIGKFADVPARGLKRSPEARARMSAAQRGRKLSDAHKLLLSERGRGRKVGAETRAKLAAANLGKKHNTATKAKVAAAAKASWSNDIYRQKTTASQRASHLRPEVKAKLTEAMKSRWADKSQREKLIAERKSRWANPEYRAKMLVICKEQGKQYSGENWRDRPKIKEQQNARA